MWRVISLAFFLSWDKIRGLVAKRRALPLISEPFRGQAQQQDPEDED